MCKTCALGWFKEGSTCPTCREVLFQKRGVAQRVVRQRQDSVVPQVEEEAEEEEEVVEELLEAVADEQPAAPQTSSSSDEEVEEVMDVDAPQPITLSTFTDRATAYTEGRLHLQLEDYSLEYRPHKKYPTTRRTQWPTTPYRIHSEKLTNVLTRRFMEQAIAANAAPESTELSGEARTVAYHPLATIVFQGVRRELRRCNGKALRAVQLRRGLESAWMKAVGECREQFTREGREGSYGEPANFAEYLEDMVAGVVRKFVKLEGARRR